MKVLREPQKSARQVENEIRKEVFRLFDIPKEEWKDAKNRHDVKHEVSKAMGERVVGRPSPRKKSGTRGSSEAWRCLKHDSPFHSSIYPYDVTTVREKKAYLKKLEKKGEISEYWFKELMKVLK